MPADLILQRLQSFLRIILDRTLVELPDGSTAILECKTTNYSAHGKWEYDGKPIVPEYCEAQGRYREGILKDGLSRLKDAHPDIYAQYATVSESRIFKVKFTAEKAAA